MPGTPLVRLYLILLVIWKMFNFYLRILKFIERMIMKFILKNGNIRKNATDYIMTLDLSQMHEIVIQPFKDSWLPDVWQ